jgi:hypothetical protein
MQLAHRVGRTIWSAQHQESSRSRLTCGPVHAVGFIGLWSSFFARDAHNHQLKRQVAQ